MFYNIKQTELSEKALYLDDNCLIRWQKFIPIMFFGKQDIHKPSVVNNMRICVETPDVLKEHIKRNKSFDCSNDHTRQGLGSSI